MWQDQLEHKTAAAGYVVPLPIGLDLGQQLFRVCLANSMARPDILDSVRINNKGGESVAGRLDLGLSPWTWREENQ